MAKGDLAVPVKSKDDDHLLGMFHIIFTAIMVLVFLVPSCILLYIEQQPSVEYFLGHKAYWLAIVPIMIVLAHQYHKTYGPNRIITVASLLIPALVILILALMLNGGAAGHAQALFSIDCDMLGSKRYLQLEWEAADKFFTECVSQTAAKSNYSAEMIASKFRVQDCTHYQDAYKEHASSWSYLRYLEEEFHCTGFCTPGRQLWSKYDHKDSCSVAVSSLFKYMVGPRAIKISIHMILVLVPTALTVVVLKPALRSLGYELNW